jgi:mannose-6-phosphate isomerase-like protein (cupin superfamily)
MQALDLEATYLSLDGKGGVALHPVDERFWDTIAENCTVKDFLVGIFAGDGPWPHWEVHPNGAELLVLLEGAMTMLFHEDGAERELAAEAGEAILVPQGVLHRAISHDPCRFLAITYGAGTDHVAL